MQTRTAAQSRTRKRCSKQRHAQTELEGSAENVRLQPEPKTMDRWRKKPVTGVRHGASKHEVARPNNGTSLVYRHNNVRDFLVRWAARDLDPRFADEVASIMEEYYRLGFTRRPEHLVQARGKNPLMISWFSHTESNDDAMQRVDQYDAIARRRFEIAAPACCSSASSAPSSKIESVMSKCDLIQWATL